MVQDLVLFLVQTLGWMWSAVFLLRFYMMWRALPRSGRLAQFVRATTDWAMVRRAQPPKRDGKIVYLHTQQRGRELSGWAALALAWAGQVLVRCVWLLFAGVAAWERMPTALLVLATLGLVQVACTVLQALVLVQALMSWVNPFAPMMGEVSMLVDLWLRPFRRVVPQFGGVDLSPLVLLLLLQVIQVMVRYAENGMMQTMLLAGG